MAPGRLAGQFPPHQYLEQRGRAATPEVCAADGRAEVSALASSRWGQHDHENIFYNVRNSFYTAIKVSGSRSDQEKL
jgi:hypothetical protein